MKSKTLSQLYRRLVIDTKGTDAHTESKRLYFEIEKALKSNLVECQRTNQGLEELAKRENQRN